LISRDGGQHGLVGVTSPVFPPRDVRRQGEGELFQQQRAREVDQGPLAGEQALGRQQEAVGDDLGRGHVRIGHLGRARVARGAKEQFIAPDAHLGAEDGLPGHEDGLGSCLKSVSHAFSVQKMVEVTRNAVAAVHRIATMP
jgi:hypothetical protein